MKHFTTGASNRRSIRWVSISAISIALACCLFLGSAGCQEVPGPDEETAIARIQELGGKITRDETKPGRPVRFVFVGERFTDDDLALLTGMKNLLILNFQNTRITGAGLDRLKRLTTLFSIHVRETKLEDKLIDNMTKLTNIHTVRLFQCTMGSGGFHRLMGMDTLRTLSMADVTINGELGEHAQPDSGLQSLEINQSDISDPMAVYLGTLSRLRSLTLDRSSVTDSTLARLKGMTDLQTLGLQGTRITDAGLESLKGMTNLTTLILSRTGITDAGLSQLEGMARLRGLHVDGTKVTDAGVKKLHAAIPQVAVVPFDAAPQRLRPSFALPGAGARTNLAAAAADVSKVPPYDDFIVVPFRIHVLQSKTLASANCAITYVAVSEAAAGINAIWSKAGIHFGLESIIREEAVQVERFKAVAELNQGQLPTPDVFAYLFPASSRVFDGLHVYLFHELPLNGTSLLNGSYLTAADAAILIEKPQLKQVAGGSKAPMVRVAARGLGQALSLSGRSDEVGLLSSGTNGVGLSEAEIGRARQVARTIPGVMAVEALLTAAGAAANAGDLAAARRYWTWLSEIPGDGAAEARRRLDALPAAVKP